MILKLESLDFHNWNCTANIYSQFTFIGCVTCATVIWQWLSQTMTVHMTFTDIEEYNMRSIAILGCDIYSQMTVAHVTLPKAVLSTVKIFAVWSQKKLLWISPIAPLKLGPVYSLDKLLVCYWQEVTYILSMSGFDTENYRALQRKVGQARNNFTL